MSGYSYRVTETGSGSDRPKTDYGRLAGKSLIVMFEGFQRGDDGHVNIFDRIKFNYEERGGQFYDDEGKLVTREQAFNKRCRFQFRLVDPNSKALEDLIGIPMSHEVTVTGINIYDGGQSMELVTKGMIGGLMTAAIAAGFNALKADLSPDNKFGDPTYVGSRLTPELVPPPLTPGKIIEHVLEPILYEGSHPEGDKLPVLLQGKTQPNRDGAWFIWNAWEPLTPDMVEQIWADAKPKIEAYKAQFTATPDDSAPSEEEQAAELDESTPFPSDGPSADEMKGQIAQAVTDPGAVTGSALEGDTLDQRLDWVQNKITEFEPDFKGGEHMLNEIKAETLPKLFAAVFPPAQESKGL